MNPTFLRKENIFSFGDVCQLSHVNEDTKSIVSMVQYVGAVSTNIKTIMLNPLYGNPEPITENIAML